MESELTSISIISAYLLLAVAFSGLSTASTLLHGLHPLDQNYFAPEVIQCKDGSNTFKRDRVNDDFCDCVDGTDEPGTSACPAGRFYCPNMGSKPQFIFSSRVNDQICDCCDGSDEYDGTILCPNICVMGGHIAYTGTGGSLVSIGKKTVDSTVTDWNTLGNRPLKGKVLWRLKELWIPLIVQISVVFIVFVVCMRRLRGARRRRHR